MMKAGAALAFSLPLLLGACTEPQHHAGGGATAWHNPDAGTQGTVAPIPGAEINRAECREFQQTITISGQSQKAFGTACRQTDGTWKIVP